MQNDNIESFQQLAAQHLGSPALSRNLEEVSENSNSNAMQSDIDKKIRALVKSGYRGSHTGSEILELIQEKKQTLISEAIRDISRNTLHTILQRKKRTSEKVFMKLEDFIAIAALRSAKENQSIQALSFLAKEEKSSIKIHNDKLLIQASDGTEITGLESLPYLYYYSFLKAEGTSYEGLGMPIPENVFNISI